MNSTNVIHEVLSNSLLEISNRYQSLRQYMAEFVNIVSTIPAAMVKVRLSVMSIKITMQASDLHNKHDEKGVLFVMMSDTVLSVHWAEEELSIKAKENLKKDGHLILSLEEIAKVVEHLADMIDSGQCAEAVEWINQYEASLVVDATRLL